MKYGEFFPREGAQTLSVDFHEKADVFGIGADLSGLSQVGGCVEDGWFVEPH